MSRSDDCACSSWASQKNNVSFPTVSYRGVGGTPICYCREVAVLGVAKIVKNCGKQFLGCPNYKNLKDAIISSGSTKTIGMKEMQP
ncbi:hypothetical protein DEO72_LG8g1622 [Vigna unguiculata]|uniref:Zinc finger GRF-type domain-containing protein n=1 Tax=Vigna unguiculata TaxID=3917 RepID=A0A4D6MUM9_VIGUN|nr:hypothetical protein DEO72_LG8g1621 [Vigna unguiculata]QCE03597.1 hypothetical protein DEO72_LG8g1622 [Vigna unguiculata]